MSEDGKGLFDMLGGKFFERFKSGPRKSLGYVRDVQDVNGNTFIRWQSDTGELYDFFYEPGAERFVNAENGFAVGDVIEMMSSGARLLSARPLKLNLKEKEEILSHFKSAGEE